MKVWRSTFNHKQFAADVAKRQEGYSLREKAGFIGISHTTLARILNGEKCDFDTALKICDWLHTSIEVYINREFIK